MTRLLFCREQDYPMFRALAASEGLDAGDLVSRRFPCGESYLRVASDVRDRSCVVLAPLHRPDGRLPGVLFLARTLRDLGACRVELAAPYLPYMRQDKRFQDGEALTSVYFADWISEHFDALTTVDPHLHRYRDLGEIYRVPATVVSAAPRIADWIADNVSEPFLIGPDAESRQWVEAVADILGVPRATLRKTRHGDTDVTVEATGLSDAPEGHTPVLVDDIASSGATLVEAIGCLKPRLRKAPVCIVSHAILGEGAEERIRQAGAARVVSTNTVPHPTNAIDVTPLLANALLDRSRAAEIASYRQ